MSARHVVMFSGGAGSFAAAHRVVQQVGRDVTLLFTDTLIEDADLYRFLIESAAYLTGRAGISEVSGLIVRAGTTPPSSDIDARRAHLDALRADTRRIIPRLEWIAEGRTPWEVFRDKRFLGNARIDPCSAVLKRALADKWLEETHDVASTVVHVGIDWTEEHRFTRMRDRKLPWAYRAPLCEAPLADKQEAFEILKRCGIKPPRLYALGFQHNNCSGGCVKAGIGHFALLYEKRPEIYAEWEANEEAMREFLGRDVAILTDRNGGQRVPLPLVQLRRRLDEGYQPDLFEIGGCGCMIDGDAADPPTPAHA